MYFKLIVHRVRPPCLLATVSALVLRFGARKVADLRLAEPSPGIAKRVFGVDYNGVEAAADLPLVARRNDSLAWIIHEGLGMMASQVPRQLRHDCRSR